MPPFIYDSEDGSGGELFLDVRESGARLNFSTKHELHRPQLAARAASLANGQMHGPDRAPTSTMPRSMTEADVFDIESTFTLDGAADKAKSRKRRQTAGEVAESPRKKLKENARSHTATHHGNTAIDPQPLGTALSDENGMMPNGDGIEPMQGAKSLGTQVARENVLMLPSSGDMADGIVVTGDLPDATIRFATGEQQMMVEQALKGAEPGVYHHDPDTVHVNQNGIGEHNRQNGDHVSSNSSGSIPWSAEPIGHTQTPSTGSKRRTQSSQSAKSNKSAKSARRTTSTQVTPSHGLETNSSQVSQDELSMPAPGYIPNHASRIGRASSGTGSHDHATPDVAPETVGTGVQDDGTSPAIPREQYKAKPSRSRSAAVEYTPTDWSVPPEKASKKKTNKRTKTSSAIGDVDVQLNHDADEQLQIEAEIARRAKEARDEDSSGARISTAAHRKAGADHGTPAAIDTPKANSNKKGRKGSARKSAQSQVDDSQVNPSIDPSGSQDDSIPAYMAHRDGPTDVGSKKLSIPVIERPLATPGAPASADPSPLPFTMSPGLDAPAPASTPTPSSMAPPSSTASSKKKKSKRSHTTIFEDHVGLRPGVEEEPEVEVVSLKQQQATRKKRGRPRKQPLPEEKPDIDIVDNEEMQDVVMPGAANADQVQNQAQVEKEKQKSVPTKRGRGRPRKSQVQEIQETQEEMSVDSEAQEQAAVVVAEEEEDLFAAVDAAQDDAAAGERDTSMGDADQVAQGARDVGTGKENGAIAHAAEKVVAVVKEKQPPHSPIKKGLTVYRVGLSRKQRIQPLLRIMKK